MQMRSDRDSVYSHRAAWSSAGLDVVDVVKHPRGEGARDPFPPTCEARLRGQQQLPRAVALYYSVLVPPLAG